MPNFAELGLDPAILKALERMNYKEPSDIQAKTIPLIQQKRDLIALAQTGSGKTAACAIPICDRVDTTKTYVQALIVVPTRELALQYATEAQKIGMDKGVKAFAVYGGEDATMQKSKLAHGVQVLVVTPGRLIDFIYSRTIDLSHVETLILDEADEMLSMGFYEDLEFIIQCLNHEHQTLLFSATMPQQIRLIAQKHMKNPLEVILTQQASPTNIDHKFLYCRHDHRDAALIDLIKQEQPKQCIIFCHSRIQCEKVTRALQRSIDGVDFLHAGLGQDTRTIITSKFRSAKIRFLVATDVAARGLDFSGVTHVIIYQLSDDPDAYVHRSGRTGRYDKSGTVITLVTDRELHHLTKILHRIQKEPFWVGTPPPAGVSSEQRRHRPYHRKKKG
jgi:ATP-dependent RNA helicase DeaD